MKKLFPLLILMFTLCSSIFSQDIIPAPQSRDMLGTEDPLIFIGSITIFDPGMGFKEEVDVMSGYFKSVHNVELNYNTSKPKKPYVLLSPIVGGKDEEYLLKINAKGAEIRGSRAGVFYGLHSLLQLASVKNQTTTFQSQEIFDFPTFSWRGLHLDVCRHFFPASYVKKYLDLMSRHKFNTFHWHLTEDQGWRIEIKKYPLLTEIGAWRKGTMVGQYRDSNYDTIRYGGFYTQEEIKEIVEYARQRHITVVPEIEMPGHAVAAISAYPFLSCAQKPIDVQGTWGVFTDVFCAGNDSVFNFLQDVLDEVCELFPGQYIHIGGDECPKDSWKTCTKCQARITTLKLKDEHELQSYFIQRMEKYLNNKGKKIIGWDEILEGGLAPNAAVMSWRGIEGAQAAADQGHQAVLTPGSHCYFDHYQGNPAWEPISIGGYTNVQKVYSFNPLPKDLPEDKRSLILGGQANLWSEYILSEEHMDYMVYPRACAMAEALWLDPAKKNEGDFLCRLNPHLLQLKKDGVNVSWSHYQPEFTTNIVGHKPAIAVRPRTADKVVIEYIPAPLSGLPIKKAVVKPDSLVETCTALGTSYKYKFISLPGSGKVVFYSGPNYISKDTVNLNFSLSSGAAVKWITPTSDKKAQGSVLVDGMTDDNPFYSEKWIGFDTSAVDIQLDLGDLQALSLVKVYHRNEIKNHIYPATQLEVEISEDGQNFKRINPVKIMADDRSISLQMLNHNARFVRIKAISNGKEKGSRMVFDEISIN